MRTFLQASCLALAILSGSQTGAAQSDLREAVAKDYEENLGALFRHFHTNPELSHREFKTAARLAAELGALGYDVTEGVGGTGIVAVLKNGEGPTQARHARLRP